MLPRSASALAACLAVLALGPARARAWTEASVRTVRVHVDLDREARALVAMRVTVRIHGGWLESLDLSGLDPDLVLDESKPPSVVTEDGDKLAPRVTTPRPGDRIVLSFSRRQAPRRGLIFVDVLYRTSLAHRATEPVAGGRVRVRWTLPPWQTGLDGVSLSASAPPGADFAEQDDESAVEHVRYPSDRRVVLAWRRVHLPRTTPWTITFDVPEREMAVALEQARPIARTHVARKLLAPPWAAPTVLAAMIAMLALFTRLGARRDDRRGVALEPLVPMPEAARVTAILALSTASALLGPGRPWLVLVALGIVAALATTRGARPRGTLRLGAFREASPSQLDRARWSRVLALVGYKTPLDATTVTGLGVWVALSTGWAYALSTFGADDGAPPAWALGALLAPLVLSGTRRHRPLEPRFALARLSSLARSRALRAVRDRATLSLCLHETARGVPQDARLTVCPHSVPDGLVRLDLAIGQLVERGVHTPTDVLVVVTLASSDAERAVADALPDAPALASARGHRIARVVSKGVPPVLARVLASLAASAASSAADRTVSDDSRPLRDELSLEAS